MLGRTIFNAIPNDLRSYPTKACFQQQNLIGVKKGQVVMGAQLAKYFQEAKSIGGIPSVVRLAMLSLVSSANASKIADSPENVEKMDKAFQELKSELKK